MVSTRADRFSNERSTRKSNRRLGGVGVNLRSCNGNRSSSRNNSVSLVSSSSTACRKRRRKQGGGGGTNTKNDFDTSDSARRITRSRANTNVKLRSDADSNKPITRSQARQEKKAKSSLHKCQVEHHRRNLRLSRHNDSTKSNYCNSNSKSSSISSSAAATTLSSSSSSSSSKSRQSRRKEQTEVSSTNSYSISNNISIMGASSSSFSSQEHEEQTEEHVGPKCNESKNSKIKIGSSINHPIELDSNGVNQHLSFISNSNSTSASTFDDKLQLSSSSQLRRSKRLKVLQFSSAECKSDAQSSKGTLVTPSPTIVLEKIQHQSKSILINGGINQDLKDEGEKVQGKDGDGVSSPSTSSTGKDGDSDCLGGENSNSNGMYGANTTSEQSGSNCNDIPSITCPYMVQSRPSYNLHPNGAGAVTTLACPCSFHYNHNDSKSLSEAYIASYGDEYYRSLLEMETLPIPSCTNSFYSGSSASSSSSTLSSPPSGEQSRVNEEVDDMNIDSPPVKFSLRSSSTTSTSSSTFASKDDDHDSISKFSTSTSRNEPKAQVQRRSLRLLEKKHATDSKTTAATRTSKRTSKEMINHKVKKSSSATNTTVPQLKLSSSNSSIGASSSQTLSTSKLPSNSSASSSFSSSSSSNSSNSTVDYSPFEQQMNYMERHKHLTPNTRSILIDWLIDVAAECELSNVTLGCGVALVDRCLAVCEYRREVDLKYVDGKCRYSERRGVYLGKSRNNKRKGKGRKRKRRRKTRSGGLGRRRRCNGDEEESSSSCDDSSCSDCDYGFNDVDNLTSDDEDDRYNGRLVIGSNTLQLLGCGCMMIASKIHDVNPMKAEKFTYLSADSYSESQIVDIEQEICSALRFHLHIVTSCHFVHRFLRASHVSSNNRGNLLTFPGLNSNVAQLSSPPPCSFALNDDKMQHTVNYLLEIAMLEITFVPMKPSLVAAGAVYLARAILGIRDKSSCSNNNLNDDDDDDDDDENEGGDQYGYFSKALTFYTGYKVHELIRVVTLLHSAHRKSGEKSSSLNAVYEKYLSDKYKSVALKVAPQRKLLFPENIAGEDYGYSSSDDDVSTDCNDSSSSESDNNSDSDDDE